MNIPTVTVTVSKVSPVLLVTLVGKTGSYSRSLVEYAPSN